MKVLPIINNILFLKRNKVKPELIKEKVGEEPPNRIIIRCKMIEDPSTKTILTSRLTLEQCQEIIPKLQKHQTER